MVAEGVTVWFEIDDKEILLGSDRSLWIGKIPGSGAAEVPFATDEHVCPALVNKSIVFGFQGRPDRLAGHDFGDLDLRGLEKGGGEIRERYKVVDDPASSVEHDERITSKCSIEAANCIISLG